MMTLPEDLDELLALVEAEAQKLAAAITAIEQEQRAGGTGHAAYERAKAMEADYRQLCDAACARVAAVVASLA